MADDFDPDAYLAQTQKPAFDPDAYLASAAPSLPTQVVQPQMGLGEMLFGSGYVGRGEFSPEAGAESAPIGPESQDALAQVAKGVFGERGIAGMIPKSLGQLGQMLSLPRSGNVDEQMKESEELGKAWRGEYGLEAQAGAITGTALQAAPLLHLPFAESPLRATPKDLALVKELQSARVQPTTETPITDAVTAQPQIPETPITDTVTQQPKPQEVNYAVQEPGTGEVLQRQPQEVGATGGGRTGVEQSVQGQETPQASTQEVANVPSEQPIPIHVEANELAQSMGGKVVGSAAKEGGSAKDIDIHLTEDQIPNAIENLKQRGFEQLDSGVVSPSEAKKSGKDFGEGWQRNWNFQNPETGRKVQLWHTDEGKLVPEPVPVPKAESAQPLTKTEEPSTLVSEVNEGLAAGEQPTVGISQARTEAELGVGSVEPGVGAEMGSGIEYGRDYLNKGGDPRLPIRRAQTSGLVGKNEVGIVHAELERLRGERSSAAKALEANPSDPVLQKNFEDADNAQRSWRKELQPVLTKASDALREAYAQSVPDVDPSTYQGLADLFDEHFKGTRDITPQMRTEMTKAAKGVKDVRTIANGEMVKIENELTSRLKGKKVMTPEELDADLKSELETIFKDCFLAK